MSDALYLVDGSGFIFRAYHALPPLTTRQGTPTGAVYGFAQMLLKLEQDHRPRYLAVVFDAAARSFRHDVYAEYKANRTAPPDDLVPQFKLVRHVVDTFGVPQLELAGYEADDLIATLVHAARARGLRVVVVSSDKDLMQLVDETVVLHDTMKDLTYGPAEVKEKFGVAPSQLGDVLALMGDSVDNVPGVPGIGPKTASALISEFGSLDALLSHIDDVKNVRGAERIKDLLRTHTDAARLSRRLVALDEAVPLPVDLETLRRHEPDMGKVEQLFRDLEFDRLIQRLRPQGATSTATGSTASQKSQGPAPAALERPKLVLPDVVTRVVATREALDALVAELAPTQAIGLAIELGEGPATHAPLCGLTVAADGIAPAYLALGHRYLGVPAQLPPEVALAALRPILEDKARPKHVHRVKDAHLVLARHGVILDGVAGDPELASYLLDPEDEHALPEIAARYGVTLSSRESLCGTGKKASPFETVEVVRAAAHSGAAAAAALALGRALDGEVAQAGMGKLYHEVELPLARVLAVMERWGVRLDTGHLHQLGGEVQVELDRLEDEVRQLAGTDINLGSPKQLQELLFQKLQLPPVKRTKTGFSTDAETLEELAPLHPVAEKIHEHRQLAKLKGTYIDAFPSLVDPKSGRLHTSYRQAVAATGRLSSSEPNLQNIPIRSELGMKIRRAFIAESGYQLVAADYSQIELRVVAHLSRDPVLVDSFTKGEDVHTRTAAEVFGVPPSAVTAEHRRVAKAINYGIVYGQSDYGLSRVLRIEKAQARKYIEGYFARYAGVASFMEELIRTAYRERMARTLLGRIRKLPDLDAKNRTVRQAAERMARNTPIQGTAADLLKLAMIQVEQRLEREAPSSRMLLTVHDELVLEVPRADATRVGELVKDTMEKVFPLAVPLQVDVGIGDNWAEC